MQDKKPLTVKVAAGLFILRGLILLLSILVFQLAKGIDPAERTFLNGARMAIVENYQLDLTDIPYALGRLIGYQLFPALFTVLGLVFLIDRKFWPFIIVLSLDLLFGISRGVPILLIIILVLILTNPARNYLRRIKDEDPSIPAEHLNDR